LPLYIIEKGEACFPLSYLLLRLALIGWTKMSTNVDECGAMCISAGFAAGLQIGSQCF